MVIRVLSEKDVPLMGSLLEEGFACSRWSSTDLNRFIQLNTCVGWGSFQNESLHGFILIQSAADEAEIILIVVRPQFRNQGIGQDILGVAQDYLQKKNVDQLFLEVSVENEGAVHFYSKSGFETVGNRKNYYPNKQNKSAYIMLKKLK